MPTDSTLADEELSGPVVDRRTTLQLLGAAGLTGLAGCMTQQGGDDTATPGDGGDEGTDSGSMADVQRGGRLTAGWFTGSVDVLDPPKISVGQYFQVAANVFNGLVTLTEDLTVRGDLASDWTVSEGGRTFTFDLREGVTFHDGTEFTAEDVRYTIDRTISEETPAAAKLSTLKPVDGGGVVVEDDYTVQLNFEKAMAPALVYLTRGPGRAATVVCKEAIEEMGADQYSVTPVGTGPFAVREHEIGSEIVLDAHDDYFGTDDAGNQLPYLDGVTIKPIPEAATIVNALRSGDIDFANVLPLQNVDKVAESDAELLEAPGVNWLGMAMNQSRKPFDSRKARRGIAKVVDNEAYVETAYFGNALVDHGPINKATGWVWRDDKPDDQDYAPEEGKQLVEEAGADGASFDILVAQGNLRPAKAMRQQLQAAGFDVGLDQVTSSTYWERYEKLDYDVTISGSVGDPDPDQSLWNFFRKDGPWNWFDYRSDEVHRLLADQRRALDRDERTRLLHDLEDHLIADVPHVFLVHQNDFAGKQPHVRGFTHVPYMRNFHTVWLDE